MTESTIHQTTPTLEQRPEAIAFKVEDLLAEIRRGRLRVPPFQRKFLWQREDARMLLDSIYRGYPVGTLLFWSTSAEAGEIQFGSVVIAGPARPDAYWVVDGQQRTVSLVRTLLAPSPDVDPFSLYFDLDQRSIVAPPSEAQRRADESRWLPMTEIVDSERLMKWAFDHVREQPARRDLAFDLGKRVREYAIPAYVVRADSDVPLREIFGRVNGRGKPMKALDVFDALNGVRSNAQPSSIEQIALELSHLRFGKVESKTVYRLLRALQGADVVDRNDAVPERLADGEAAELYARTYSAAKRAIEFLEADAGIAHYTLLPYKQTLVALGKFFELHPSASVRSRQLLARWLWRGALAGTHRGDTVSTRRVLDAIDGDEHNSVQRLLNGSGTRPGMLPDATAPFNFRHAVSKLETLALMDLGPRDVSSGKPLNVADLFDDDSENGDHRLPPVFSTKVDGDKDLAASAANRLVHPSRRGIKKALVDAVVGSLLPDTDLQQLLLSLGIDESAQAALIGERRHEFFVARQRFLREHFEVFFNRRAQWDANDRPSIASLVAADEEK
jgi:Protein of unknown function DUF262